MNHHAWTCRLVALGGIALAFAPIGTLGETLSKHPLGFTAVGAESVASVSLSSDDSSGKGQQATVETQPRPSNDAVAQQALAKPPQVTYENGQLTIIAESSSLSDVMKALREALGADIDLPAGVADQHIWVHLGPGPARRVLRDLLDGTEFNYVIQASENDTNGILSVSLTRRSKSTGPQTPALSERTATRLAPAGSDPREATDSENPARESAASVDSSQATPPEPPAGGSSNAARLQNAPLNSASSAMSAPTDREQQIQQLQSMYQQRRQLQMQQNQKAPGQN